MIYEPESNNNVDYSNYMNSMKQLPPQQTFYTFKTPGPVVEKSSLPTKIISPIEQTVLQAESSMKENKYKRKENPVKRQSTYKRKRVKKTNTKKKKAKAKPKSKVVTRRRR